MLTGPPPSIVASPSGTLITLAELHRLTALLMCEYDIDVCHEPDRHWVVMLTIAGRCYGLSTVRGQMRRWRRLDSVLAFLRERCGDPATLRLHTPAWTFKRVVG
ncbi:MULTISPECIES: hypothetical protein [unclassified Cupriavidus]|uniref:hypothetical protein n=1 Tax=Cupriavidus sp. H19C3 TaxID=3241603 RepID=UPI003BF78B29